MKPLVFGVAAQGGVTYGIPFSDSVMARELSPATPETVTVPAGAKHVVFSATKDFWCKPDGTAAIPGDVTDGTAAVLNPTIRNIEGVATLSLVANEDCVVTVEFFS